MAKFTDILKYYRSYTAISIFSVGAMSLMEILDLVTPYAIGQILNLLSKQPVDAPIQALAGQVAQFTDRPVAEMTLWVLLGMIGLVSVGLAPLQPWLGPWFNWDTAFRARRDHAQKALEKVLTLPLEFYDENNPGRIAARVAKGLSNHTWTYPEVAGQLLPKFFRVVGIFVVVWWIEWRIALLLLVSFVGILAYSLSGLKQLAQREETLDKYAENTESRTSEIITNIKTVKAFATEADELKRQRQRFKREFQILDYRIHLGYTFLGMTERTVVQSCVFGILGLTL
jgi:ATP-binding cassette, subfamily B, bacterial